MNSFAKLTTPLSPPNTKLKLKIIKNFLLPTKNAKKFRNNESYISNKSIHNNLYLTIFLIWVLNLKFVYAILISHIEVQEINNEH